MDNDRRARIIRLLETRDDGLPEPRFVDMIGKEGKLVPPRGFRHGVSVEETCPDCFGERPAVKGCGTCGSQGTITTFRERDPYAEQKVEPIGFSASSHDGRRELDSEIARLDAQLAPPRATEADILADANKHPDRWEVERQRLYRLYDYGALDRALELLRDHDQGAYHLVHSVYVYGWSEPSSTIETLSERGLRFIDQHMPDPIRAPGYLDGGALRKARARAA